MIRATSIPSNSPNSYAFFTKVPFEKHTHLGKGFVDLAGIRTFIADHVRPGLPGLVNVQTYNEVCRLSVHPWNLPLEVFIDHTLSMLRVQLDAILRKNLGMYERTELFRAAQQHLYEFIDEHADEQRQSLKELYKLETYKSFTVNRASISEHEARELQNLKAARKNVRAKAFVERQIKMGQKKKLPAEMTFEERKKEIAKRAAEIKEEQLPKDPFQLELRVAAYVRGYYTTAAFRFG
jgi:hypothetical protein